MLPEDAPSRLFERWPFRGIVERIQSAIRAKTGFSLIRLGDGEGPVMLWPDFPLPDQMADPLKTWFGHSDISPADLTAIANGLREATRTCDVLGLPTRFQLTRTPRYGMVLQAIEHFGLYESQMLTDAIVHWYLQWSGALRTLLRGSDVVHVIGCRDIGSKIAAAFDVRTVTTQLVRGEHSFPGAVTKPHWPDGFDEVMGRLEAVKAGEIYLIGAGALGKIYCDKIKVRGGIAVDIGSLLDSWADVPSRERYKLGSSVFALEHFKSVGEDWQQMLAALDRCAKQVHSRDATLTY